MSACFQSLDILQGNVFFLCQLNFILNLLVDDLKYWQILLWSWGAGCEDFQTVCKSNITGWLNNQFVVSSAVVSVLREVK